MRLRNSTPLDSVYLARVVNIACLAGEDASTLVIFESIDGPIFRGRAWPRDSKFRGSVPHAYIGVPREPHFPQYPVAHKNRSGGKGWTVDLRNVEEALVCTVAHELAHLRRGPSERLAHAWAMRMLRKYRRKGLPAPRSVQH